MDDVLNKDKNYIENEKSKWVEILYGERNVLLVNFKPLKNKSLP
jgi:hypothetical protein